MPLHVSIIFRQRVLTQLTINENLLVYNLKARITKSINIPTRDQTLTFDGVLLENCRLLRVYKLPSVVDINMNVPLSCPIKYKVFITAPFQNRPLKLRMRMERTLGEMKKIIEQYEQVPSDQQIIVYDCCIFDRVDDALTLAALGIKDNAKIEVILKYNKREDIDSVKTMRMKSKMSTLSPSIRQAYPDSNSEVVIERYRPK
uniref:Ubiquitin 3 n=1 Tax=Echinococcus granulosus TaxID=6210 RepID=A0A068WYK1_ECHGR|nr:ubiquitin 3 [Echinococcus granulosus]